MKKSNTKEFTAESIDVVLEEGDDKFTIAANMQLERWYLWSMYMSDNNRLVLVFWRAKKT